MKSYFTEWSVGVKCDYDETTKTLNASFNSYSNSYCMLFMNHVIDIYNFVVIMIYKPTYQL